MADPLTLSVLGAAAATEGIKFLYGQASAVLQAWRERRAAGRQVEVPFLDAQILDAPPTTFLVDMDVVAAERSVLSRLIGALHPYASGLQDVEEDDEELARNAGDLRALLEATYGLRLTFAGESRQHTGSRVDVQQILGTVTGHVVGAKADLRGGQVGVAQRADEIREGGTLTGYEGQIGG
jgi:hypothetical protein